MEQKSIKWSELLEEALKLEGSFGNTYNRFYNYSFLNQLLLFMQGVNEPVNTYKRWLAMGRQVQKGCKAKEIMCPMIRKHTNEDGLEQIDSMSFRLVRCLFSLSETDGEEIELPEPKDFNMDLLFTNLNIAKKEFTETNGNIQGYAIKNEIAINPLAKFPIKTILHEVAHIVLGHTTEIINELEQGIKEFQAEATAYILMNELNLIDEQDASESRAYIQNWLKNNAPKGWDAEPTMPTDKDIKQVFSAVNKILNAGRNISYGNA